MAISARFAADFTDFQTGVEKAQVTLKTFETGAGKVQTSLTRMANSLSGTKLIQDATLAAEAVERVGGISHLTAQELARLSAQAQEAAAKMRAMGIDVPPSVQRMADAMKTATAQAVSWQSALSSAASTFGIAFSAGSALAFGKSVFDTAGKIHDMAEQLGISAEAVQGFKFAAEQAGSSLDTVGTALTKMNVHLADGDTSTIAALTKAGLSFDAIRAMKPEDAFLAITDAIEQIADPMVQADVALKVFGKSAAELLPAIKEGFRGAADAAAKMSDNTIDSLEAAGDAWGKLADLATIATGTLISEAISGAKQVTDSWRGFALFAENALKFGVAQALVMADGMAAATAAAAKAAKALADMAPPAELAELDLVALREAMLKAAGEPVIAPDVIPTVEALGAAATTTGDVIVTSMDNARSAVARLNDSFARTQALLDQLDANKAQRDADWAKRQTSGGSVDFSTAAGQATAQTSIEDYIRAFSGNFGAAAAAYAADQAARAQGLAALGGGAVLSPAVIARAGSGVSGPVTVPVAVNVSGVFDPATARQLADVVSEQIMAKLRLTRQFVSA